MRQRAPPTRVSGHCVFCPSAELLQTADTNQPTEGFTTLRLENTVTTHDSAAQLQPLQLLVTHGVKNTIINNKTCADLTKGTRKALINKQDVKLNQINEDPCGPQVRAGAERYFTAHGTGAVTCSKNIIKRPGLTYEAQSADVKHPAQRTSL